MRLHGRASSLDGATHTKEEPAIMPMDSATLLVNIQVALGLSQRELGAIIGKTKRTIQRWQSKGTQLLDEEAAVLLADRLRPVRPDLADEVLALGRRFGSIGPRPVTPEALAAILGAAAAAGGSSPEGARPLVLAAFQQAVDQGVDVGSVVVALRSGG